MNPPNECLKEKPRKIVFCHQKLYSNEKKDRHILSFLHKLGPLFLCRINTENFNDFSLGISVIQFLKSS